MGNHVTRGKIYDNGPGGWTTITPSSIAGGDTFDTNIIYVSDSTGDDTWDGSQPVHTTGIQGPVKTLIKAIGGTGPGTYNLDHNAPSNGDGTGLGTKGAGNSFGLRKGKPDWILLKTGDTWTSQSLESAFDLTNGSDQFGFGGLSAQEPMVIASYDPSLPTTPNPGIGARPIIKNPGAAGIAITDHTNYPRDGLSWSGSSSGFYLTIMGIDFYCEQRDPASGAYLGPNIDSGNIAGIFHANQGSDLFIEDCVFRYQYQGCAINNGGFTVPFDKLTIRRCVAYNDWGLDNFRGQGFAIDGVTNMVFEENVIDQCGNYTSLTGGSTQGRNCYFQHDSFNPTVRGNISARSASQGFQLRAGGVIEENFMLRNSGTDIGHEEGDEVVSQVAYNYNVITESVDIGDGLGTGDSEQPQGLGVNLYNMSGPGIQGDKNIITHGHSANPVNAYMIQTDVFSNGLTAGTHGVVNFKSILYDWQHGIDDPGSSDGHGAANDFSNCPIDTAGTNAAGYKDPTVTAGTYAGTIGLTNTYQALLTACRGQKKGNWDPRLTARAINDYFRINYDNGSNKMKRTARNVVGGF